MVPQPQRPLQSQKRLFPGPPAPGMAEVGCEWPLVSLTKVKARGASCQAHQSMNRCQFSLAHPRDHHLGQGCEGQFPAWPPGGRGGAAASPA